MLVVLSIKKEKWYIFPSFSNEIVSSDKLIELWRHHKGEEFINTLPDAVMPFHTRFIKSDELVAHFLLVLFFFSPALIKGRTVRNAKSFWGWLRFGRPSFSMFCSRRGLIILLHFCIDLTSFAAGREQLWRVRDASCRYSASIRTEPATHSSAIAWLEGFT